MCHQIAAERLAPLRGPFLLGLRLVRIVLVPHMKAAQALAELETAYVAGDVAAIQHHAHAQILVVEAPRRERLLVVATQRPEVRPADHAAVLLPGAAVPLHILIVSQAGQATIPP